MFNMIEALLQLSFICLVVHPADSMLPVKFSLMIITGQVADLSQIIEVIDILRPDTAGFFQPLASTLKLFLAKNQTVGMNGQVETEAPSFVQQAKIMFVQLQ